MPALPSARVPYKRVRMFRILFSQKDLLWNFQYEYKQRTFWLLSYEVIFSCSEL